MADPACVSFLQWALPRLGLRWVGFSNVRGQVCKRLARRARELGLPTLAAYRTYLEANAEEWSTLAALCRVTISRFYRDRGVFDRLCGELLPATLAAARTRGERSVRAWSAGCASGEEPYTVAMAWTYELAPRFPELSLSILATDIDDDVLTRARTGCYEASSLREVPAAWRDAAFLRSEETSCVRDELKALVEFRRENIRETLPDGPFHLVLCRNLAFTYFDEPTQRLVAAGLVSRLAPGGLLVVGSHERVPFGVEGIIGREGCPWAYSSVG
jgi:chemotaxis protein methyltransferase CheR